MEPSIQSLIKERKYPFAFAFFVLLLCVSVIVLTNNRYTLLPFTDLQKSRAISSPPGNASNPFPRLPPPPLPSSPGRKEKEKEKARDDLIVPSPPDQTSNGGGKLDLMTWELCKIKEWVTVDYIPCLDNMKAIKALKSRRHMEHRERHCPSPSPRCLLPLPQGYKIPVPWPKSRDMIWFDNVPHPKLVEYKKDQNWVQKSGDYFVFPGGGTQFKGGVKKYVEFIDKTLPSIGWGKQTRVILDVGCGVASFGGYLLEKDVLTMSFAPKDEHEAQIQFALERGIPAFLSVIGTQKLNLPDNVFDLIHCARCRVHWDGDGGKPLMELNRILRPGGFFIWSATPVYRDDSKHLSVWNSMVALTESICWKMVAKTITRTSARIGLAIYQKPISNTCYEERKENNPPLCDRRDMQNASWYVPLLRCLPSLPQGDSGKWPTTWPERLGSKPPSLSREPRAEEIFFEDTKHWSALVSDVYLDGLAINWSSIRNVMDMNAGYGGFAAALIDQPFWVMNVVPFNGADTLAAIFDRGLIGIYHDWCEAFNTYPRTYDLLHSSYLFGNLTQRCDSVVVIAEMDRILRPGGWILVQENMEMINKLNPIFQSLHWETAVYEEQFLVGKKGFWRPTNREAKT
ncbi:probable methyltransferase PMT23 [Macadamia integrifolia]|uniref:probable methyltransferase PMT23 n=1 Tax=Macadamia integrifolia TaxID=60698 RepID=UPI001C4E4994|nr:probable methyltransferase PMT23 [Macadamia integrifolia]